MKENNTSSHLGNTPPIKLSRAGTDSVASVWLKVESDNPTEFYKDRIAGAVICDVLKYKA